MTREFLENFKVGDQQLPAEIIDAILAENGRDVAELESVRIQLKTAEDGLAAFQGVDVQELQGKITALQNDLKDAKDKHAADVADMAFNHTLESAIAGVKGRSVKAILGELGAEKIAALKGSKNQAADIKTALDGLMKESAYLFDTGTTPPPYAAGTGVGGYKGDDAIRAIRSAAGLKNE